MTAPGTVSIETANPDQAVAWNGHEGEHWAAHADRFEQIGDACWQQALDQLTIGDDAQVLDVGCGTGKSTRDLARRARDGAAVGIDLSAPMLAAARQRATAEGVANVTFLQADAQIHPFAEREFDVVVSSFGAMFFADPAAAFTNLRRAMRPGGRLALLAWRELQRNEWLTAIRGALAMGRDLPLPPPDAPTPFSLADPDRVDSILTTAGFDHIQLAAIDEALTFGADTDDAFEFLQTMGIVEWLTHDLDATTRAEALDNLRTTVEAHAHDHGVSFASCAWLITARAP